MYAIFADGGKQYKVSEGDIVLVEVRTLADGQKDIQFDTVLMVGEGGSAKIGQPYVVGASVKGEILAEMKLPKVRGIKHRRRKGNVTRWGHRQQALRVKVTGISG